VSVSVRLLDFNLNLFHMIFIYESMSIPSRHRNTYGNRKRKRKPLLLPTRPTLPLHTPITLTNLSVPTPATNSNMATSISTSMASRQKIKLTKNSKQTKKPKLQQLFLDFGQKSFSSITCKICHMLYAPGREEDEAAHRSFHRRFLQPVTLRPNDKDTCCWRSERLNRQILRFSLSQANHAKRTKLLRQRMSEQLENSTFTVDGDQINKRELIKMSSSISNSSRGGNGDGERGNISSTIEDEEGQLSNATMYVYLKGHQIAGAVTVNVAQSVDKRTLEVLQLWVEPKFRKQRIATHLVDTSRSETIYGELFDVDKCEMHVRSLDGDKFWSKYSSKI
jgi:N-acetyltransferase